MTACVQELAGEVWDARYERRVPRDATQLARALAMAVAQDVEACASYDPELDMRVKWLRVVIDQRRKQAWWKMPKADPGLELGVLVLLGRQKEETWQAGIFRSAGI